MQIDPALRMLGLAAKAGKVASGEFMTENSVKRGWLHWLSSRQMHPTTRRRSFAICVSFMKSQCMSLASKMY